MYPVQKGVPIPAVDHNPKRGRTKYAFEAMVAGDMFFVPGRSAGSIAVHVSTVAKKLDRVFAVRQTHMRPTGSPDRPWTLCEPTDPEAVKGAGVWRTS